MKRLLGVLAVVIAVTGLTLTSEARADHRCSSRSYSHGHSHSYSRPSTQFYFQIGNGGFGISSGRSYYDNCPSRSPVWHDTSHYDYRPTQVIPHRDHYHVIPGHYDYHRTGHWHY